MSNETKPLLSDNLIANGHDLDYPRAMTPYQVRAFYEGQRSKLMAVLQVCADAIDQMKQGSFADKFVFADDAELKAHADGILSQLKAIGVVPNK